MSSPTNVIFEFLIEMCYSFSSPPLSTLSSLPLMLFTFLPASVFFSFILHTGSSLFNFHAPSFVALTWVSKPLVYVVCLSCLQGVELGDPSYWVNFQTPRLGEVWVVFLPWFLPFLLISCSLFFICLSSSSSTSFLTLMASDDFFLGNDHSFEDLPSPTSTVGSFHILGYLVDCSTISKDIV